MEFALKDLPKEDWKKPDGVYTYTISKTSGKLASEDTPPDQRITTMTAIKLNEYDTGIKTEIIDTLCNGPLSENTPV
jgi:membrane carboxypeptidase/penicillin-binding protein